jgi:hypothetical protein
MKTCYRCKIEKEENCFSLFNKLNAKKEKVVYFQSYCKKCSNEVRVEHSRKFRDKYRANNIKHYQSKGKFREKNRRIANRELFLFNSAKARALKQNVPFDITVEDIVIPKFCPLLEIEFNLTEMTKGNINAPSLDKIIPELGYVKGNIKVISLKANFMKSNASIKELSIFKKNISKYLKNK